MSLKSRFLPGLAMIAVAGAVPQAGLAATVTETYAFSFSDFVATEGGTDASPYNSIAGTFTLTFDPTVAVKNQTTGITVDSLVIPGSGSTFASLPIVFTFLPNVIPGVDLLSIGGASSDGTSLNSGTNDLEFFANITDLGAPSLITCAQAGTNACGAGNSSGFIGGYTLAGYNDVWHPTTGTVAAVPEPSTYALMLAGLAAVGFAARRRKGIAV